MFLSLKKSVIYTVLSLSLFVCMGSNASQLCDKLTERVQRLEPNMNIALKNGSSFAENIVYYLEKISELLSIQGAIANRPLNLSGLRDNIHASRKNRDMYNERAVEIYKDIAVLKEEIAELCKGN